MQAEAQAIAWFHFAGKCTKEIERYCEDVEEGDAQLATCMSDAITQAESESGGMLACMMLSLQAYMWHNWMCK